MPVSAPLCAVHNGGRKGAATPRFSATLSVDVRNQLSARDAELAVIRAAVVENTVVQLQAQLKDAGTAAAESARQHASGLAAERARYDGLSKQLLRETAHQRETFQTERTP
ncbi:hypothetical protein [Paraburkholderia sp. BR14374]|uniref:hypothetical protein n=1 Tax=Paraburkholderia sp. BR14374 TaxID=3237007 RepID=UPI0034CEC967